MTTEDHVHGEGVPMSLRRTRGTGDCVSWLHILTGWAAVSVPASLLVGTFIRRGAGSRADPRLTSTVARESVRPTVAAGSAARR